MKTAEEWWNESVETVDMIRRIQADALRHAAGLVDALSFEAGLEQAAMAIEAEADKLEGTNGR